MSQLSTRPQPSPSRWQRLSRRIASGLLIAIALAVIADGFLFDRSMVHLLVGHTVLLTLCTLFVVLFDLLRRPDRTPP